MLKVRVNKCVHCLKCWDCQLHEHTLINKFQMCGLANENAPSPRLVLSRGRTCSELELWDSLAWLWSWWYQTVMHVLGTVSNGGWIHQCRKFVTDMVMDWKPVKLNQRKCNVISWMQFKHQSKFGKVFDIKCLFLTCHIDLCRFVQTGTCLKLKNMLVDGVTLFVVYVHLKIYSGKCCRIIHLSMCVYNPSVCLYAAWLSIHNICSSIICVGSDWTCDCF